MEQDSSFDCNNITQFNELVKEMWKKHPQYTETDIRRAIKVCCDNTKAPTEKEKFIVCIENNLHWLNM